MVFCFGVPFTVFILAVVFKVNIGYMYKVECQELNCSVRLHLPCAIVVTSRVHYIVVAILTLKIECSAGI